MPEPEPEPCEHVAHRIASRGTLCGDSPVPEGCSP
jgi:hypothetical protein